MGLTWRKNGKEERERQEIRREKEGQGDASGLMRKRRLRVRREFETGMGGATGRSSNLLCRNVVEKWMNL